MTRAEPAAIPFWSPEEIEAALGATIAHLQSGGVLAYPTETVYGFGGAADYDSVERLVKLKRRPSAKPFLLLVSGSDMLTRLGLHLTRSAARIAARHWPGPVTLVLPGGERRVPDRLRGPGRWRRCSLDAARRSHAADSGVRRSDHVDECESSRGTAGDGRDRDFGAMGRRGDARHHPRARRRQALAIQSIRRSSTVRGSGRE